MSKKILSPITSPLKGRLTVPGDKSISHRAVIFGSLAKGTTTITHFLDGEDCFRTIDAFRAMGVPIQVEGDHVTIQGHGVEALQEPLQPLYLGNSGTTTRLLLGVLAGLPFHVTVHGDNSLTKRPMDRIVSPLRKMGARIDGREEGKYLPLSIRGGKLHPIHYQSPVKSAQVKSGILLAGLLTEGETSVTELASTRDHTELMLSAFNGFIQKDGLTARITGNQNLKGTHIDVPGDISSAAFFLAAGAIVKGSKLVLTDVGINPTRTGIIDVLQKMGASIQVVKQREVGGEPVGDITIEYSQLQGVELDGDIIPRIIDEIPIIALLASQANGKTVIRDAEELRYKETDRIEAVVKTLSALGASIEGTVDGMIITGEQTLKGATVDSFGDHRIGMMIAVASLLTNEPVTLKNSDCIAVSYPTFFDDLNLVLSK
ncbi:3-phosphoshikimate 1-carboxyvinyltransferase [Radiobacillus deserti]|uniref:3-phosphoshikimate 1-carboxyvinyltransferase n=1 Tax=Radiobacillus deserti TaxID=2594883 RepID=A0A516KGD0_9BACI|nr:3-phosphoshikimate 1-carboxyvinyltransferase [Radiobacillus deserti]QDP40455.1 3-phosphoshikimate 1-carboxyvinyltransferase [Radiobacillus deserti]